MAESVTVAPVKPPLWQRALGIVIGTAVGGVIYGIFLQALLIQSLVIDRKPLDPAEWKEKLSGRAWICGLFSFLTMVLLPLKFINRTAGATVLTDQSEAGVGWFLIAMILLIQIATVVYAVMRKELRSVEHPIDTFEYFCISCSPRKKPVSLAPVIVPALQTTINPVQNWVSVPVASAPTEGDAPRAQAKKPLLRTSFSLSLWKNWVQITIILIEFLQLFSMAVDGGRALNGAGVSLFPPSAFESFKLFRNLLWQFGMDASDPDSYSNGFGALTGFGGLYILLCGIFIALDLTVDSWLAPFHFTLLAGGFYGSITSGLLFLILFSPVPSHVVVCLLMLAYYSSTAVFVSIYRSDLKKTDRGEIRIIPVFTAIERVSKGVLAAASVCVGSSNIQAKPALALAFGIYLSIVAGYMKPYSVSSITGLRITSLLLCSWTAFITLICSFVTSTSNNPIMISFLFVGWLCSPILVFVVWKLQRRLRGVEELNCVG